MLRLGATLLLGSVLAAPVCAQDGLPASFGEWTSTRAERARAAALEPFAGEQAAALREYGIEGAERRTYARGTHRLGITLYQMRDASGAYGAATFLRTPEMRDADLGRHSAISPRHAVALVGNLVVVAERAEGSLLSDEGALKGLVSSLYPRARMGLLPTVGDFLPRKGLVPGSRRYLLGPVALSRLAPLSTGDWIGFADGAEVELAQYRVSGGQVLLLLASYPTAQVAAQRLEELARRLPINPTDVRPGTPPIFAKRSASLVALVVGTSSQATANLLLEPIRYDADVTWNEPGFSATDPNVGEIVLGAIYGTGAMLLFSLAAGIGFGGVRLVAKYLLPGKVFDRPGAVEIIQLGITSKPIEAKDFYL